MDNSRSHQRIVYYPCCANDVDFPIKLMGVENTKYIFCDIRSHRDWHKTKNSAATVKFLRMDAWVAIDKLPEIDILFYRRDGMSEGGSGVEVLGDEYLQRLLKKFPISGGKIITDGSNAFGCRLDYLKMGLVDCSGFKISFSPNQDLIKHDLMTFEIHK